MLYAITALSQFSSNPGDIHWNAVKRVLRYLKATCDYKLTYGPNRSANGPGLFGFCDADWGNSVDDRKSVTGYAFIMYGGAVSWNTRKQPTVALSSMEAEYMAATEATKEAIWLRTFMIELGMDVSGETFILCDNQGAMELAKNPGYHSRSKHIDIRHHFIREAVENKIVTMKYINTNIMERQIF